MAGGFTPAGFAGGGGAQDGASQTPDAASSAAFIMLPRVYRRTRVTGIMVMNIHASSIETFIITFHSDLTDPTGVTFGDGRAWSPTITLQPGEIYWDSIPKIIAPPGGLLLQDGSNNLSRINFNVFAEEAG